MDYNKLVSVTGLSGLFELISSKTDSGIVRSLEDNSTKFVSTRIHSFSHLESIEVYTVKENVNLVEIFTAMKNSKTALPDGKADAKGIKAYFEKVYPDMDFERVYSSDMKKMVKWFDVLKKNNVEIKLSEVPEEEVVEAAAVKEEPVAKKTAAKKVTTETKEEPVAKKTTAKKKAEPVKDAEPVAKKTPAKKAAKKKAD